MTRALHVGDKLSLPPDAVTQTLVVYGIKGMGKTNFGTVLCEELAAAHLRFAVLDPIGNFWALRHAKDGRGPGIEVLVLGGRHGDLPIEPTAGGVVADLVADEDVDVVVDISRRPDGKMWSLGERTRFVAEYCTRLYERQGERARPLMQIIDEAGRFVPQLIPHGQPDVARCVGAVERMVEEGRNVGIGVCLLTQRSARMNKSVSELAECMVAFRTVGPRSVDAILDWLGEHVEKRRWTDLLEQLRKLPRGEALVVSPGWLNYEGVAKIRERRTFDSSATPRPGQERGAAGPGAKPDLSKYQQRMAATIEKARAEDPRELRRQLAAARTEIASLRASKPAPAAQETRVEVPVLRGAEIKKLEGLVARVEATLKQFEPRTADLRAAATEIATAVRAPLAAPVISVRREPSTHAGIGKVGGPTGSAKAAAIVVSRDAAGPLPKAERAILTVLAQQDGCEAGRLALLAGYRWSGGFRNSLSALRTAGLMIGENSAAMRITDQGFAALGDYDPLPTGQALIDYWLRHPSLGKCERAILEALIAAHPKGLRADELAARTGYEWSGGFRNALSALRTAGLMVGKNSGEMRAIDTLFQDG